MSRLTSKRVLWVIACFVAFLQPPCLCFGSAQECPSNCSCDESKGIATCAGTISVNELNRLPSWAKKIKFSPAPDLCDDVFKQIIDFAHSAGIELMGIPLDCGETKSRKRRDVAGSEPGAPNTTAPSGPDGLPVFPCDFEQGFCQWLQSSDSDFQWTRHKGSTASLDTGPSSDHTTVNGTGWYIYIETSDPNREGNKARLVSPTLRPVDPRNPCNATFFTHMYGNAIGQLNIVQAPVIGHDVTKLSITSQLGNMWVMKQVVFDSSREFQIVLEGVRGSSYRGDIALDDITFSEGCQRLEPGYIRLDDGDTFNAGEVTVYYNGSWGRVCSDYWTQATADVVCRELGFVNASKSTNNGTDTTGKTAGFESLICSGGENAVSACASSGWSDELRCTANKTAAVVCQGVTPVCPAKNHVLCPNPARNATLAKCISHGQLCDFVDDCGDGWDETGCANYTNCTFEDPGLCGWIQAQNDEMEWTRNRGSTPTGYTGPGSDHTGNSSRYYIYVEVSGRSSEKASLAVTPRFQGNHEGLCRVRFFYHMYGWDTGQLRVLLVDWFSTRTVWEKRGSQGQIWKRAEVTLLNTTRSFRVIFEAEHTGNSAMGDIALDDVSFTPECRPAAFENVSCTPESYKCRSGECISLDLLCDFNKDCLDGSDEENCGVQDPGRCNFEASFCDWKNLTDDDFDFSRRNSPTPSWGTGPESDHTLGYGQRGYYIYIESSSPRVMNDKARLASPQFMWKGVTGCKMSFFYHMWSEASYSYMGTLKVLMKNAITSQTVVLWQRSGSQGNKWLRAIVPVNTTWTVTQIVFEAIRGSTYRGDIALDDVSFSPQCYPSEAVHLDKNYDVRLAGAKASYQGRVEIFRVGQWGTVCSDEWNTPDTEVVCKQLGYSKPVILGPVSFGPGKGPIWLDNVQCYGNETSLDRCQHNGWANHDCTHSKDVTVVCDINGGVTKPVRLSSYPNNTNGGLVEIYHAGAWGLICYDHWDLHDAHVACRQVGLAGVKAVTKETVDGLPRVHLGNVSCVGSEDTLASCPHSGWGVGTTCNYGYAGVVCTDSSASEGDVRLFGGRKPSEGRVEIFHLGEWGTVCEDGWTEQNARVVCYELGFTGVVSKYQSFGPGRGHIWLNNVQCSGIETSLVACGRSNWGQNPCSHTEDVGVICSDDAYVGCYKDSVPRVMSHKSPTLDVTPVKCIRYCQARGYQYSGLEWSTECYCGALYSKYGNASESECASPCAGDVTKICGGPYRLSVYVAQPVILPSSSPGYPPVRQSCSQIVPARYTGYSMLLPMSMRNYFAGTHTSGYITSPNYPSDYPNNVQCVWVLNLQPGTEARITFVDFKTELKFDYVEIRDGKRSYSSLLTPYLGISGKNLRTRTYVASTNSMWIKFTSDSSIIDKGFKLNYYITSPTTTLSPVPPTSLPMSSLPNVQMVQGSKRKHVTPIQSVLLAKIYYSSPFIPFC